jgi:hypothetical protein
MLIIWDEEHIKPFSIIINIAEISLSHYIVMRGDRNQVSSGLMEEAGTRTPL